MILVTAYTQEHTGIPLILYLERNPLELKKELLQVAKQLVTRGDKVIAGFDVVTFDVRGKVLAIHMLNIEDALSTEGDGPWCEDTDNGIYEEVRAAWKSVQDLPVVEKVTVMKSPKDSTKRSR